MLDWDTTRRHGLLLWSLVETYSACQSHTIWCMCSSCSGLRLHSPLIQEHMFSVASKRKVHESPRQGFVLQALDCDSGLGHDAPPWAAACVIYTSEAADDPTRELVHVRRVS